jgi:hypothetical protein
MPRRRSFTSGTLCLALLLLCTGCGGSVIVDDWPELYVRGTVQDHTGAPLGSAFIRAEVRELGCTPSIWARFDARTDARGRFQTAFEDPRGVFKGCLIVEVTPAPSSAHPVTTLTLDSLYATPKGHDSELELTLTLPAR